MKSLLFIASALLAAGTLSAEDWPQWGRTSERNMVSPESGITSDFNPGKYARGGDAIDPATTKNVKWITKLGSQSYGNPTVAAGRLYVGTNNEGNDDPRFAGKDFSLLKCLDAATGKLLWQLTVPKLGSGKVGDWEYLGICSSPAIDDGRVYLVTNRCEMICLDADGLADGNDGFQDEGQYMAGPDTSPLEVQPHDADILWRYDMREELGVFPHNITASSPLIVGNNVFVSTSNGVDWSHTNIPNPKAPSLVGFNKLTGELIGEEGSGISQRILHGAWSSPSYGASGDKGVLIYGGPDGNLYGFDPIPAHDDAEDLNILKELWRYDGNPKHFRFKDGDESKPIQYARPEGPSEFIATPVVHNGRVYAATGQDPEHGEGIGNLSCLDLATGKKVWDYPEKINRSLSTCAITDNGLLFIADFSGYVYCLDAQTGNLHWRYDTKCHIWGSTLVADGKVFVGTEDGELLIFAAAPELKRIGEPIFFADPIYSTPVVANGVLYVTTTTHLYAIGK